jgi:hypothetical protein
VETRLTLRPGQSGTNRLVERFGERLVRARYLYDEKAGRRLKTVELIVESVLAVVRHRRLARSGGKVYGWSNNWHSPPAEARHL